MLSEALLRWVQASSLELIVCQCTNYEWYLFYFFFEMITDSQLFVTSPFLTSLY